jgi:hypothetical protein
VDEDFKVLTRTFLRFRELRVGTYVCDAEEFNITLMLNDFPAEPMWTAWYNGKSMGDLEFTPGTWVIQGWND